MDIGEIGREDERQRRAVGKMVMVKNEKVSIHHVHMQILFNSKINQTQAYCL